MVVAKDNSKNLRHYSTSVIRPVKQNQLSFPCIEIYKATSFSSQQCLVDQIHVQKPFKLLSQIRCLIMLRIESSVIRIDSNITDNIRWLITKTVGAGMEPRGTPALTGYSCQDFPFRTTQSCLLLRKEEIRPNI